MEVSRFALGLFALTLLPATATAAAAPSPAPSAAAAPVVHKPLRHLAFSVDIDQSTQTDMRTIDVAASKGGNTEHYVAGSVAHGTIVCDIVGVTPDGNLLVDVTEDSSENRSSATKRVAVQKDGGLVFLPNQGTLNEEESELVTLLAPGLMGGDRATGDSWTYRQTAPNYSASKTFRLSEIKNANDVSLSVEETYTRSGADGLSGTILGTLDYDPASLVPLNAKLNKTTRQEDTTGYKTRKLGMTYTLKEDSLTKH